MLKLSVFAFSKVCYVFVLLMPPFYLDIAF